jgi:hypothetical protein
MDKKNSVKLILKLLLTLWLNTHNLEKRKLFSLIKTSDKEIFACKRKRKQMYRRNALRLTAYKIKH